MFFVNPFSKAHATWSEWQSAVTNMSPSHTPGNTRGKDAQLTSNDDESRDIFKELMEDYEP